MQRGVGTGQHRLEVHLDDTHRGFVRHILEPTGFADAGVVPHHVEPAARTAVTEVGQRALQGALVRHVDGAGPESLAAELATQLNQTVVVAVHRTDSPTLGVEELCPLAAHAAARASDEDRFHGI